MGDRPLILVDPLPRTLNLICGREVRRRPEALGRLVVSEGKAMPDEMVDRLLPEATMAADAQLIPRGPSPVRCRRADPAIARRLSSMLVSIT